MLRKLFLILCICFACAGNINTLTAAAADNDIQMGEGQKEYVSETGYNKEPVRYSVLSSDRYIVDGKYAIDTFSGEVYYCPGYTEVFKGGIADDRRMYDADGKQINTYQYIVNKYAEERNTGKIVFTGKDEMSFYMRCLCMEEGATQGNLFTYILDGDKYIITEENIDKILGDVGEEYKRFISETAALTDRSLPVREQVEQTAENIFSYITYDLNYTTVSLNEAVTDRRRVCYHYTRMLKDVLSVLGIKCEVMSGTITGTEDIPDENRQHCWIRAWDEDNGRWVYVEATNGNIISYKNYLTVYIPCRADGNL